MSRVVALLLPLALVALGSWGCGDPFANERRLLQSRCEVHLDDLQPVVDPGGLTSSADFDLDSEDPNIACELYLFRLEEGDEGELIEEAELIESGSWGLDCDEEVAEELDGGVEEPDAAPPEDRLVYSGCQLWIEPELVNRFVDGVMLCDNNTGESCQTNDGERTICAVEPDSVLSLDGDRSSNRRRLVTGAVVAVDTFDEDPSRVAVTTMTSTDATSTVTVQWLELDDSGEATELISSVEVCDSLCLAGLERRAPEHAWVGVQTATRGENLLLAGPCGARAVVEVSPDGACQLHQVVGPEPVAEPEVVIGVTEAEGGGFLTLWTDGLHVYSTLLEEHEGELWARDDGVSLIETLETQSRETPDAMCTCLFGGDDCENGSCAVLWTEVTRFAEDEDRGERTLLLDAFGQSWRGEREQVFEPDFVGEGYGGRLALTTFEEVEPLPTSVEGVVVFRHEITGLQAQGWHAALLDSLSGMLDVSIEIYEPVVQLGDRPMTSDFSLEQVTERTFAAAWWERGRDEDFQLGLALLGLRSSWSEVVSSVILTPGFFPMNASDVVGEDAIPRPVIQASVPADGGAPQLLVAAHEGEGVDCQVSFALMSLEERSVDDPWERTILVESLSQTNSESAGPCQPGCRGVAEAVPGGFLVALPGLHGPGLWLVRDDGGGGVVADPLTVDEPAQACRIDIVSVPDEDRWLVFSDDQSEERRIRVVEVTSSGGWRAEVRRLTVDGQAPVAISSPLAPHRVRANVPSLMWTAHRFGDWRQVDFDAGRVLFDDEGVELRTFPDLGQPIVDSRVALGAARALPCSGHSEGAEERESCALFTVSRPDFSDFRESPGFDRSTTMLTPRVEVIMAEVPPRDDEDDWAGGSQYIDLIRGGTWRGLTTDVVATWSDDDQRLLPVAALSETSPLIWERGIVAAFGFSPADPGLAADLDANPWVAQDARPFWMMGEEEGGRAVTALRLDAIEPPEERSVFGAAWTTLEPSAGPDGEILEPERQSYLSVIDRELQPFTSGVLLHAQPVVTNSEDRQVIGRDPRMLMAEHLDVALGALSADRFFVVWRQWSFFEEAEDCYGAADLESLGEALEYEGEDDDGECRALRDVEFIAAQVVCRQVRRAQLP